MTVNTIIIIVAVIATLLLLGVTIYYYVTTSTLEEIRADVYQLFLKVEHEFESGQGKQKLEHVVSLARSMLPKWAQAIFTYDLLYMIIDEWFDEIKDLLDDGKSNNSIEGE